MESGINLKVIYPEKLFYEGKVDSVIVKTPDGYEGFMTGRAPCCKLLAEDGRIKFRCHGETEFKEAIINGGFLYMNGDMLIYTDAASWPEDEEEDK